MAIWRGWTWLAARKRAQSKDRQCSTWKYTSTPRTATTTVVVRIRFLLMRGAEPRGKTPSYMSHYRRSTLLSSERVDYEPVPAGFWTVWPGTRVGLDTVWRLPLWLTRFFWAACAFCSASFLRLNSRMIRAT